MNSGAARVSVTILLLLNLGQLFSPCESGPNRLAVDCRRLLDVEKQALGGSFSLHILHRDHVDSPLRDAHTTNLTFALRMKDAARRSRERGKLISNKIQMSRHAIHASTGVHSRKAKLLGVRFPTFAQEGEFLVRFNLGTPPRNFVAILDSGSDLVWVQCKPCRNCVSVPEPLFDPTESSSYEEIPCGSPTCNDPTLTCTGQLCAFRDQYGDGTTTTGAFALETITIPSTLGDNRGIPDFAFGCATETSGDLAGSDGIVGLGHGPFSLPSQLAGVVGNAFSFCLVSMFESSTKTSPLVIGNDSLASVGDALWTPIVKNDLNPTYYYVQVKAIKVNGRVLSGIPASTFTIDPSQGSGGTILDTGTTISELLPDTLDVLKKSVTAGVLYPEIDGSDYGFDLCWDTTTATQIGPVFPIIAFQFDSSEFVISMENAYLQMDTNVYCLTFDSGFGVNIIGNVHLQNTQVFVNNDAGLIGWKPVQCDQIS